MPPLQQLARFHLYLIRPMAYIVHYSEYCFRQQEITSEFQLTDVYGSTFRGSTMLIQLVLLC
jgi:hypothetical protein